VLIDLAMSRSTSPSVDVARWLAGERVHIPSRAAALVLLTLSVGSLFYAATYARRAVAAIVGKAPPSLPPDQGDVRFGVPLRVRKEIFATLAAAEPQSRVKGVQSFNGPGLEWSAEDHRGAFERQDVAAAAQRHGLTLTQVYLILDEGIRERWPGPDGAPLNSKTVPLNPRRKY